MLLPFPMQPWCYLWQRGKVLWVQVSVCIAMLFMAATPSTAVMTATRYDLWHVLGAVVSLLHALQGCAWRPLFCNAAMTATSGRIPARLHCRVVMGSVLQPACQQPGMGLDCICIALVCFALHPLTHYGHHGQGFAESSTEVVS